MTIARPAIKLVIAVCQPEFRGLPLSRQNVYQVSILQRICNVCYPDPKKTPTQFPQHPVPDAELSDHNNSSRGILDEHLQSKDKPTPGSQPVNTHIPQSDLESSRTRYVQTQPSNTVFHLRGNNLPHLQAQIFRHHNAWHL